MNCKKCGEPLRENETVCAKCGTENNATAESTSVLPKLHGFSSKKNVVIIALAGVLALGAGGTAVAYGVSNTPANRISRYMGAAERYLSEMNYEPAVIEFQRILEIDPMNVDAYLGLAEAYIAMDDRDKAQEVLNNGYNNTRSDDIKGHLDELEKFDALERGDAYLSESKFKDSITEYKKALSLDNKCIEAYIGIADAYMGRDWTKDAVEYLRKGFSETGDERFIQKINEIIAEYLKQADRYLAEKSFYDAELLYYKVLGFDDKCVEAYIGIADACILQGRTEKADEILQTGLGKTDDDRLKAKLNGLLAEYLKQAAEFLRTGEHNEAISCYKKALNIDEKCTEAYIGIADSYIGLDKKYEEIQILETGYEKTRDEEILRRLNDLQEIADSLKRAKELFDNGLYEQAADEYVRAQEIDPMCVDAYLGEAQTYTERGDSKKAIEILHKGERITGKEFHWK